MSLILPLDFSPQLHLLLIIQDEQLSHLSGAHYARGDVQKEALSKGQKGRESLIMAIIFSVVFPLVLTRKQSLRQLCVSCFW